MIRELKSTKPPFPNAVEAQKLILQTSAAVGQIELEPQPPVLVVKKGKKLLPKIEKINHDSQSAMSQAQTAELSALKEIKGEI